MQILRDAYASEEQVIREQELREQALRAQRARARLLFHRYIIEPDDDSDDISDMYYAYYSDE